MRIPSEAIAPVSLAITLGVGAFSTFLPKTTDIIDSVDEDQFATKVRIGELGASGLAIILGIVLSYMIGDISPLVGSIVIVAVLVAFYEYALSVEV